MHETPRWLVTAMLCALAAFGGQAAPAQEPDYTDVNAYILQAEMALQREDYLMAVQEYRKAAYLSDNPDIAKKATASAIAYGFDDDIVRRVQDGDTVELSRRGDLVTLCVL